MKRIILVLILLLFSVNLFSLVIKIGSLAPEGTPWHDSLLQMAKEWKEISNGKIRLKIYPGGVVGNEEDMIRKIRIGQLQGAVLTGIGINKISPETLVLSLPMFIHSEDELDKVFTNYGNELQKGVYNAGFQLVSWQKAGWLKFFSKKRVQSPNDLLDLKIGIPTGEPEIKSMMQNMGYNVIPINTSEIMNGLQTGMIDTVFQPPVMAASLQWFAIADNMCDLNLSPLIGGFVISNKVWKRIPKDLHEPFMESVAKISKSFKSSVVEMELDAINVMKQNGLNINMVSNKDRLSWNSFVVKSYDGIVGNQVPEPLFISIRDYLESIR